jgi:hypothetical protein
VTPPRTAARLALATTGLALALWSVAPGRAEADRPLTPPERAIVARNASLAALDDQALVRRALEALGTAAASAPRSGLPGDLFGPFDPAADPDLAILQRASPEAAHDLFQLIKKASAKAGAK